LPYSSGGITVAEKLQGLLEKIRTEGLEKAEAEKQKIIDDAKKEAQEITKKAKAEAEEIIKKAKEDAGSLEKRSETAVKQASRDIMLKLKGELQKRLENIVHNLSNESMTPEFMGELIKNMADAFSKNDSSSDLSLEILTSSKDCEKLAELLKGNLAKNFKETPEVFSSSDVGGGLKIGFKGNDVFFDFTDDAICDLICAYVSPKLAELLEPAKK
jgi:vacuolar-type H+-ATPase subunit E/Vma4